MPCERLTLVERVSAAEEHCKNNEENLVDHRHGVWRPAGGGIGGKGWVKLLAINNRSVVYAGVAPLKVWRHNQKHKSRHV